MKQKYFDVPVDVYDSDGSCFPNVVEVFVGDSDEESYIADENDDILFFCEMSTSMMENVFELLGE